MPSTGLCRPSLISIESESIKKLSTLPEGGVLYPGFALSRDGTQAIIGFSKGKRQYYEFSGIRGESYEACTAPVISNDSRHYAYGAYREGKWWVITDSTRYGPFDELGSKKTYCWWMLPFMDKEQVCDALICRFSDDGNRMAFAAGLGACRRTS
jgi:hypothetical protein